MIVYQRDYDKTHDETIKTLLRSHNAKYSNHTEFDRIHLYKTGSDHLYGAFTVDFFWDWAGVKAFYYEDLNVLKTLVQAACNHYKDKAKGMKFYTPSKRHFDDFRSVGFTDVSRYTYPDGTPYYFADIKNLQKHASPSTDVQRCLEAQPPYQDIVEAHMETYRKTYRINDPVGRFDVAAIIDDKCIGGIQCEMDEDSMTISRIAVDPVHRGKGIGSNLIESAIDHAISLGLKTITLGTSEFQGRPFYESFAFKVIHKRDDNPKGYKNYTMIKEL